MKHIALERADGVGVVTLNRPETLNAFNDDMYGSLSEALVMLDQDDSVSVIVLLAAGKDFSSGNDIEGFLHRDSEEWSHLDDRSRFRSTEAAHRLAEIEKPLIAAVQGRAIGFGATALLHCDLVIVEASASMRFPFVTLGLVPEAGSTLLLAERVGSLQARYLLMTGAAVNSTQACELGLALESVADGDGAARALALAKQIASNPRQGLVETKRLLNRCVEPLEARIAVEFRALGQRLQSEDAQTILRSLLRH
ncbi:enoyl-CoA hydratase-related protein [Pseudohaliea sp.]|uniref:enoyl-CoA hydratase/isomerase family protein n=1 Tax=Pseudohaliea sp. TaxID=2740289 RepID=UPI0032ECDFCC